jgi:Outer membrane protein beta-barrel domain
MKKLLIIPIVLLAFSAQAQDNYFYFNWDINTPTSNTEWIGHTSSKGGKVGYRMVLRDKRFSIGADFGWTTFDQYAPTETFEDSTGAISTDYFKYIYQATLTASGQYYFKVGDGDRILPYAGLGLGAMRNRYRLYYNIYVEGEDSWGFLARPEAGVVVRFPGRSLALMAAVHYDIATNQSVNYNYKNFSAVGFQIGVAIMNRY